MVGKADDGMEGGADPCGAPGGGPDVRLGTYDGDADEGDPGTPSNSGSSDDYAGAGAVGGDLVPPAGTSTNAEPRMESIV